MSVMGFLFTVKPLMKTKERTWSAWAATASLAHTSAGGSASAAATAAAAAAAAARRGRAIPERKKKKVSKIYRKRPREKKATRFMIESRPPSRAERVCQRASERERKRGREGETEESKRAGVLDQTALLAVTDKKSKDRTVELKRENTSQHDLDLGLPSRRGGGGVHVARANVLRYSVGHCEEGGGGGGGGQINAAVEQPSRSRATLNQCSKRTITAAYEKKQYGYTQQQPLSSHERHVESTHTHTQHTHNTHTKRRSATRKC